MSSLTQLFSNVLYYLTKSCNNNSQVKQILRDGGAQREFYAEFGSSITHVVTDDALAKEDCDCPMFARNNVLLVTPEWVLECSRQQRLVPATGRFLACGPLLLKGAVICSASHISGSDKDILHGITTYFGGIFLLEMDSSCTHLILLYPKGPEFDRCMKLKNRRQVTLLRPEWLLDIANRKGVPDTTQYLININKTSEIKEKEDNTMYCTDVAPAMGAVGDLTKSNRVCSWFECFKFYFVTESISVADWPQRIIDLGGIVVKDYSDDPAVVTHVVSYFSDSDEVRRARATTGQMSVSYHWLAHPFLDPTSHVMLSPVGSASGVPNIAGEVVFVATGFRRLGPYDCLRVVSGTEPDRDLLKDMIVQLGAEFNGTLDKQMSTDRTVLVIVGSQGIGSAKHTYALQWKIPIVNHLFLEDCLREWKLLDWKQERYTPGMEQNMIARPIRNADSKASLSVSLPVVILPGLINAASRLALSNLVERIGGTVTLDPTNATHAIISRFQRTPTFMAALCYVKHVVSPRWLIASVEAGLFLSESDFPLEDGAAEKKHSFSLTYALTTIRFARRLANTKVYISPHTFPTPGDLWSVILGVGGTPCLLMPGSPLANFDECSLSKLKYGQSPKSIIISCPEDLNSTSFLSITDLDAVYTPEFIYQVIYRPEIQWMAQRLTKHVIQ